jgi:ATP-dependent DNA helicase RecQ
VVVAGFDRPNIRIEVERVPDPAAAAEAVRARVADLDGTGIVYVATRRDAEALAVDISTDERPGLAYHAGLSAADRAAVHERFTEVAPCVVAATTAFGMGIDVPHVRFVVHAEAPESLDAYLQELGRAGRDGDPALAVLVHAMEGGTGRRFFSGVGAVDPGEVEALATVVQAGSPVPVADLAEHFGLPDTRFGQLLGLLGDVDAVVVDGDVARWEADAPVESVVEAVVATREVDREVERSRRAMVDRYVDGGGCRWRFLLGYFGEAGSPPCGRCDACDAGAASVPVDEGPFPLGSRVRHAGFGEGEVVGVQDDDLTVLFDTAGYRTLAASLVAERGLLERL